MRKFILLILALTFVLPNISSAAQASVISLPACSDTYITGYSGQDLNFGDSKNLIIRPVNYRTVLVKFDLSGMPENYESVILRLYKTTGKACEISVALCENSWEEESVTHRTRPSWGSTLVKAASVNGAGWINFDVTDIIKSELSTDKIISFALYAETGAENNNMGFSSREGGINPPSLVLNCNYTKRVTKVSVTPEFYNRSTLSIPSAGEIDIPSFAKILDQYGQECEGELNWSLESDNLTGLSINSAGVLNIKSTARAEWVKVCASCGNITGEFTYALKKEAAYQKEYPSIIYSAEDLPKIREKVLKEPYKSQYNESYIRRNRYTLDRLDNAVGIAAFRTQSFSGKTPADTAKLKLTIELRDSGNLRIDKLSFMGGTLVNPSFESDFSGWSVSGTADVYIGTDSNYVPADGKRYAELVNNDGEVSSVSQELSISENKSFSGSVSLGQEQANSDGAYIIAEYINSAGEVIREDVLCTFNRPTITKRTGLTTEHCANVYMVEGDPFYAQKAKKLLIYSLWEMRWGMNHYMTTGQSLDDTYEAVHIGRAVKNLCIVYDKIKDVSPEDGGITQAEENIIREHFYWIADTLMDVRYYDYITPKSRMHNYNADRSIGLLMFSITFPGYYYADEYMQHAVTELNWILENSVGDDGGWPESTRYHKAVLQSISAAARALRRYNGYDMFREPKVKKMFEFMMKVQTPVDKASVLERADYAIVGDADFGDLLDTVYAGIEGYYETDPEFASNLQFAVDRDKTGIVDLYYSGPENYPAISPELETELFPDMGYVAFRQDYGEDSEDFSFYSSSGALIGSHQHEDRGSFTIYSDSTAISVDSGMCDYSSSETEWYESPAAHNTVTFFNSSGAELSGPSKAEITDFYKSDKYDFVKSAINGNGNSGYKRNFAFIKNGFDAYLIWDDITGAVKSRFGVHALSPSAEGAGTSAVTAECYNGKAFDVSFLLPANASASITETPLNNKTVFPQAYQKFITAEAEGDGDFLTLLYPRDKAASCITAERLSDGLYGFTKGSRAFYAAFNTSAAAPKALVDEKNGVYYKSGDLINAADGELVILFDAAEYADYQAFNASFFKNGNEVPKNNIKGGDVFSASVAFLNKTNAARNASAVLAVYDKDGRLADIVTRKAKIGAKNVLQITFDSLQMPDEAKEIKIFT